MPQITLDLAATLRATFEVDGVDTNPSPDTCTVTITRWDGEVLVSGESTDDAGTGAFTFDLVAAKVNKLGRLKVVWTAAAQQIVQYVDVVGAHYFTVHELHTRYSETASKTAAEVAEARAEAEETIEGLRAKDGTHVAFVQRAETFTFTGSGGTRLSIPRYNVRSVLGCTIDGEAVDVADLRLAQGSVYYRRFPMFSEVVLTVAHGDDIPPARIKSAAMLLAKELLISGPIDSRASAMETAAGGTITLALPGRSGYVTGIPEVDAAITQFGKPAIKSASVVMGDKANLFPVR